jgi:hypothetical protein
MMKQLIYLLVTIGLVATLSCKKKYEDNEPNPPISHTPEIELVKVSPTTVQQLDDSIVFTIHYTDGDGDLGFASADSMSVELTDNRFPLTFYYHLQPLSPNNTTVAITGELPIVLDNTILQNSNNQPEQATFSIRIKDRANNWSNKITTQTITVNP